MFKAQESSNQVRILIRVYDFIIECYNSKFESSIEIFSLLLSSLSFVLNNNFFHSHALWVQIPDSGIRKMILHMIQLEPELRFSAESYLQNYAAVVFPTYFSPFLHNFYCCWNPLHSDMRVTTL